MFLDPKNLKFAWETEDSAKSGSLLHNCKGLQYIYNTYVYTDGYSSKDKTPKLFKPDNASVVQKSAREYVF